MTFSTAPGGRFSERSSPVENIWLEHNVTFVFSTHDKLVMDFSRRLIKLHDARVWDDLLHGDEVSVWADKA